MKFTHRIALVAMSGAMLTGCSSSRSYSESSIYSNLTPELKTLSERPSDVRRNLAVVNNANLRMLGDDLGRVFYTNHPSRLSPFPVVSYSGIPW